jgi:Bacterial SH3 domain
MGTRGSGHEGSPRRWTLVNTDTGKEKLLGMQTQLHDLSPDKLLGIIYEWGNDKKTVVIDLKTKEKIGSYNSEGSSYFITNNLVANHGRGIIKVYTIEGELVSEFNYLGPVGLDGYQKISFHKVRNSEYGIGKYYENNKSHRILLKTSNEKDYLNELDLLFHPVAATANDSRVRIRKWPLLDAKHLGYLTTGDKLEILDRSGIKVKIGEMEGYWYKLRRISDRMEGWSFGTFIDLDEVSLLQDDVSSNSFKNTEKFPDLCMYPWGL